MSLNDDNQPETDDFYQTISTFYTRFFVNHKSPASVHTVLFNDDNQLFCQLTKWTFPLPIKVFCLITLKFFSKKKEKYTKKGKYLFLVAVRFFKNKKQLAAYLYMHH